MRIVEILVGVNALLGIGAFLTARQFMRKAKRLFTEDEENEKGRQQGDLHSS